MPSSPAEGPWSQHADRGAIMDIRPPAAIKEL
jgi:hypothetical protein